MFKHAHEWYKIADPTADTAKVENLKKALSAFSKKAASSRDGLVACVTWVIRGGKEQPATIVEELISAIQQTQPDFPADIAKNGQALRMGLAILLGEIMVAGKYPAKEAVAITVLSAMHLRDATGEGQLKDVFETLKRCASDELRKVAIEDRELSDIDLEKVVAADDDSVKALRESVSALERNFGIAREEVDLLWWAISGYSELANAFFADMPIAEAVLYCPIEVARMSMLVPMRTVTAILQRQIITGRKSDQKKPISIARLAKEWKPQAVTALNAGQLSGLISKRPAIFPTSWIGERIRESGLNDGWQNEFESRSGLSSSEEKPPEVWAAQIFNERMAIRTLLETLDQ